MEFLFLYRFPDDFDDNLLSFKILKEPVNRFWGYSSHAYSNLAGFEPEFKNYRQKSFIAALEDGEKLEDSINDLACNLASKIDTIFGYEIEPVDVDGNFDYLY